MRSAVAAILVLALAVSTPAAAMVDPDAREIRVPEADPAVEDRANIWVVTGVSAGVVALLLAWGTKAWWEDGLQPFSFRDAGGFGRETYAGGADKVGHAYANYMLTHLVAALYRTLGMSPTRAAWYAAGGTFLVANWIELIDGFTSYGFEYADVLANTAGVTLGLLTKLFPELEETVGFRMSYVPSRDFLDHDKTMLKWINDYSGMTFYGDVKLRGIFHFFERDPGIARFLLLGVVYGTDQYSPIRRDELRRRLLGLNVGLDFAELLRWQGEGDHGIDAVAGIFDYYAVPFLNVALIKDLNSGDWFFNFGVANRFEIGI